MEGRGILENSGGVAQIARFAVKHSKVRWIECVTRDIEHAAREYDQCGNDHARSQNCAYASFDALLECAGVGSIHGPNFPLIPLKIISTASAAITAPNARRNKRTLAVARTYVPASEPPRTPNITGMASTGSIYPRLRYTPALAAAV